MSRITGQEAAAGASALLLRYAPVRLVHRISPRLSLLDVPTERSSHVAPTPRGGGAGAITAALIAMIAAAGIGGITWRVALALIAVVPTAIAGWIDDRRSVSVSTRLVAHVFSGVLLLPLALPEASRSIVVVTLALGCVMLTISAINVLNFMDGIDGIIGLQAIILGLHYAILSRGNSWPEIVGLAMCGAAMAQIRSITSMFRHSLHPPMLYVSPGSPRCRTRRSAPQ